MVTGSVGNLMFGTGKTNENDNCCDTANLFGLLWDSRGRGRRYFWRLTHRSGLAVVTKIVLSAVVCLSLAGCSVARVGVKTGYKASKSVVKTTGRTATSILR